MKKIFLAFCAAGLLLCSCKDNTDDIGLSIISPEDEMNVKIDTFLINSSTFTPDGILSNATGFLIGNHVDANFGEVKASLLAQIIYPKQHLTFPEGAVVDSLTLIASYSMHTNSNELKLQVYELPVSLNFREKYYTNINTDWSASSKLLGEVTLTKTDFDDADTLLKKGEEAPHFYVNFSKEVAGSFMDTRVYESEEAFKNFFKGVYITPSSGETMLGVDAVNLLLTYHYTTKIDSKDSTIYETLRYPANNEVRQVNAFTHNGLQTALDNKANDVDYIYTPAAFFTKVEVPVSRMLDRTVVESRKTELNRVRLTIEGEKNTNNLLPPDRLLLIPQDDVRTFFEQGKLPDGKTSFVAACDTTSTEGFYTYKFDMTYYLQEKINKPNSEATDIETFILVPARYINSAYENEIRLRSLKLRNKNNTDSPLKISVIYSDYFKP